LPPEGAKILLVLFLSFLTGLEREERRSTSEHYSFGGVRTYPLIGLIGYATSLLAAGECYDVMGQRTLAVRDYQAAIAAGPNTSRADTARKYLRGPYRGN